MRALGVDEHSYLSAKPTHATIYATTLVDLTAGVWLTCSRKSAASETMTAGARSGAPCEGGRADLTDTYRSAPSPPLPRHPVADPFHVIRVANRMVDQIRRRVQNETLFHRAQTRSLVPVRKLLLKAASNYHRAGRR